MGEKVQMTEKLVIPNFALSTVDRKPIDEEFEIAFVYYMAEEDRKRTFLGRKKEIISFIAKAYYGIWAYPLEGRWVFLDPLKLHSFSQMTVVLPPIDEFMAQLRDAHSSREFFDSVLVRHGRTFSKSESKVQMIKGLLEKPLAFAFVNYIHDVGVAGSLSANFIMLPLRIDDRRILEVVHDLNDVRGMLEEEIARLEETVRVLDEETSFHMAKIEEEIVGINKEYKQQMEGTAEIINRSVEQLKTKKELEMKMILSRFEERKDFFNSQIGEYRKLTMYLKKDQEALKGMIDSSKSSETERSYFTLWKKIMKDISSRTDDVEKEIEGLQAVIRAIDNERGKEMSSIERAYSQLIESKMKLLYNIDIERELEVNKMGEQAKFLSAKAANLRRQILEIHRQVQESLRQIEQLPLQEFKNEGSKLICIPFYLVCFEEVEGGKRYKAYPPSVIEFSAALPPLRWAQGISSQPLRPYSGQISDVFEVRLIEHLKSDPILEEEVYKEGKKLNMVSSNVKRKQISDAIDTVFKKGWMTQRQASSLKKSLKEMPSYQ